MHRQGGRSKPASRRQRGSNGAGLTSSGQTSAPKTFFSAKDQGTAVGTGKHRELKAAIGGCTPCHPNGLLCRAAQSTESNVFTRLC
ncbi:g6962 [Coccomyxa viridis]|uniref:G6962 protein n=1 Tax=Coccomyxa viridis TaxID=1274662 RepID=A0ABP1FWN6_9CHLO